MTDDERRDLFLALADALRTAGVGWVVDEVMGTIAQGLEEEVTTAEWTGIRKPKRGEVRITRREHDPLQRILLLTGAVRRIAADGLAIEAAVASGFYASEPASSSASEPDQQRQVLTVRFVPEPSAEDPEPIGFEAANDNELALRAAAVEDLIAQLEIVDAEASA